MDKSHSIAFNEIVSERTPRPLLAPVLQFDLAGELAALRQEPAWTAHGHNARTLVKHSEYRLVLITLRRGAQIPEQAVPERISVHVLSGRLQLRVPDQQLSLAAGQLVSLDRHTRFAVSAEEETGFLLWLGWSNT